MPEIAAETAADIARVEATLKRIGKGARPALVRALNRGLVTARARAATAAAKRLGIPSRVIKRRLWPTKATKKKLTASLGAGTRRFPVTGRTTRRGVTGGRGASRQTYAQAWIGGAGYALQRMAGQTADPAGLVIEGSGRTRYPIQLLTLDPVAAGWVPVLDSVKRAGIDQMLKRLDSELSRLTGG